MSTLTKTALRHQYALVVDTNKCKTGCADCVSACGKENGFGSTGHPETDGIARPWRTSKTRQYFTAMFK